MMPCCYTSKFRIILLALLLSNFIACKHQNTETVKVTAPELKEKVILLYSELLPIETIEDTRVSKERFFSGKKSLYIHSKIDFSAGFKIKLGNINNLEICDSLEVKFKYFTNNKFKGLKVVWTIDDANGKNLKWTGDTIANYKISAWNQFNLGYKIDKQLLDKNNVLNIYIWNPDQDEVWVDDFEVNLFGRGNEQLIHQGNKFNYHYDFESNLDIVRPEFIKESKAYSGKMTCDLSEGQEFGIAVRKQLKLFGDEIIKKLSASIWVYPMQNNHDLILTISCMDKATNQYKLWQGKSTIQGDFKIDQWTKLNFFVDIPVEKFSLEDEIEVGIWNRGKTAILVDDLHIVFGNQPERVSSNSDSINRIMNQNEPVILNQESLSCEEVDTRFLLAYRPHDVILNALFYKTQMGIESIVHLQKSRAKMFYYNPQKRAFDLVWETENSGHPLLQKNCTFFSGDFDHDKIGEILVIHHENLNWETYQFLENKWAIKLKGINAFPDQWCQKDKLVNVSNRIIKNGQSVLVKCNKNGIETLSLDNGNWNVKQHKSFESLTDLNENDFIMDWNDNTFLKLNTNWRFDLKLIAQIEEKFKLEKKINLSKNLNGQNPKYYEYTQLYSGNFISNHSKHLLITYFNCNNLDYNGSNCLSVESNKDFPNGINFYH
jgi:hypothetical protein